MKYSAEKSFCLKNLPDNLKILFDSRKQGLIFSLLKTGHQTFPFNTSWHVFVESFRLYNWLPLDINDDISHVEDKIEKGTFPDIPLKFGNVID